jgi:RNA polymerase sigma-70 factor, ECF subfamily
MTANDVERLAADWAGAQRTVAAFVRSLVTDFHQSEEILQRVAMTLVRKQDEFDESRSFVAWALGVAKLEVLAYFRQQSKDRLIFDDALVTRIAESHESAARRTPATSDRLADCIEQLDGRARQAIQLRYADNLRTAQIANAMAITDGAARMVLSRARSLLRRCLEGHAAGWEGAP